MSEQFAARLKELRGYFQLSQQELGDLCGLSQKTVSNLEKGRDAKAVYLEMMERAFPQVRPSWLRSGIGSMLAPAAALTPAAAAVPAAPDYAADLVAQAENVLLREQIAERNERIRENRELIDWLRAELGKSPGSAEATGYFAPAPPRPAAGFRSGGCQLAATSETRREGRALRLAA